MAKRNATAHLMTDLQDAGVTVCAEAGKAPSEVLLFRAGRNDTRDGRFFLNAKPDDVIAAFTKAGEPLPVDLDHDMEWKGGGKSYGWIEGLANKAGAIWASISWTVEGRDLIESKAYRFISPAFHTDDDTIVRMVGAGLTNKPALRKMQLASERPIDNDQETDDMKKELCKLLGLSEDASEAAIIAGVGDLKLQKQLASERADPQKFVPKADYDLATANLATAKAALASVEKAKHEGLVDGFVRDGKVAPASKEFWINACSTLGFDAVKAQLDGAPKIVGGKIEKPADPAGKPQLTADQKKVAASLGVSEADFAKDLLEQEAA